MHKNWNSFKLKIAINTSKDKIFNAWSTSKGLEQWFLSNAEFTKKDGSIRAKSNPVEANEDYKWEWYGFPDYVEYGLIKETNHKDSLTFSFQTTTDVTIKVGEEAGENIITLVQDRIEFIDDPSKNLHVLCGFGWTFYLANLKSVLEGGLDLRNRNNDLKGVVNG